MHDLGYRYENHVRLDAVKTDDHVLFLSSNWFNYVNLAGGDNSGMLRFLTDELQDAEDKGDRGIFFPSREPLLLCFTDVFG